MAYSKFSEIRINGEPIDWLYWHSLKFITPLEAAMLAHLFDPHKAITLLAKDAYAKEKQSVDRLAGYLADKQPTYTLPELIKVLIGYDAGNSESWSICRESNRDSDIWSDQLTVQVPYLITSVWESKWSETKSLSIPQGMIEIVSGTTPPMDKKALRDADAVEWLKTIHDINALTIPEIKTALVARDKNLWGKGFYDWNRTQTVWGKKKTGTKAQPKL